MNVVFENVILKSFFTKSNQEHHYVTGFVPERETFTKANPVTVDPSGRDEAILPLPNSYMINLLHVLSRRLNNCHVVMLQNATINAKHKKRIGTTFHKQYCNMFLKRGKNISAFKRKNAACTVSLEV